MMRIFHELSGFLCCVQTTMCMAWVILLAKRLISHKHTITLFIQLNRLFVCLLIVIVCFVCLNVVDPFGLGFLQLNCSNWFHFRISFLICDEHLLGNYRLGKTFRLFWMLWLTQLIRLNVIDAMVMPINLRPLLRFHIHFTDNERAERNKRRNRPHKHAHIQMYRVSIDCHTRTPKLLNTLHNISFGEQIWLLFEWMVNWPNK